MPDPFHTYRPLLDLIGYTEGTDRGRGYNETLAYGAYTGGDRELVRMTLDEIDHLQTAMLAHPRNKWNSSALGRYQIVRTTLRQIRKKLGLPGSALFDEAMQDRMACFLLGRRGIDRYLAGKKSEDAMINALAKEWASLPTTSGKGHYGGQHAAVTVKRVRYALADVKSRHANPQPAETPASAQKPPRPTAKPPKPAPASPAPAPAGKSGKKTGIVSAILSALGLGGAGAAAQADADRLAGLILAGLVLAAGVALIVWIWRGRR